MKASSQLNSVPFDSSSPLNIERLKKQKSMSNMDMALDILRRAQRPLHISEIIAQVKAKYGVELDRESLVSALVKKVHRHQELSRTAPNTFRIEAT